MDALGCCDIFPEHRKGLCRSIKNVLSPLGLSAAQRSLAWSLATADALLIRARKGTSQSHFAVGCQTLLRKCLTRNIG